jgi:predicted metal-dependent peptidase
VAIKKSDQEMLEKVREGFRRVGITFPYLSGLIQTIRVDVDEHIETMGVFASGRLLVNPGFVRSLSGKDLVFVLTHELYHLTLRTHQRGEGSDPLDFNYAHDYIINDLLREELQYDHIPAGGLDWPGARLMSAEKIMGEMRRDPSKRPQTSGGGWCPTCPGGDFDPNNPGQGKGQAGDALNAGQEKKMFPGLSDKEQQAQTKKVEEQSARAAGLKALTDTLNGQGRGADAGGQQDSVSALRGLYRPPWELALQRWMESATPGERSYARPSRRGADRTDVVLPGHKREGWTLHVVLDTSGSMVQEVPPALGAIADFCEAMGVNEVHLIQCDTDVGSDEVLAPAEVARWQVTGYGGSDLSPALRRLAEDPDVAAAVVLTDGDIAYPDEPMPYNVLWVLPAWKRPEDFSPRYGKVIAMTHH